MNSGDIAFLSIRELGALLRGGDVTPLDLARIYLERLNGVGREIRAVVTVLDDVALREARLATEELAAGLDRGPLHGIPYGLKDIIAATGAPTTWGVFADQRFEREATVVTRLRNAGAVLAAKLATIEIAGGMGYDNPDASTTGPAANPWDTGCWTSGSSSGPAGAVSAAAVPFAIGSDTSGSILFPAAFTGTAGLRATYGRVSRAGAMTLCWTLDRLGPMCRTADDCGLVLEAIAGPDPRDRSSLTQPYAYNRSSPRREGFRFAVVDGCLDGAEPEVAENFERSLAILREIGTVETVELPDYPYGAVTQTISSAEAYAAFDEFIASGRIVELKARKAAGHRLAAAVLPAHDYIRAQRIRRLLADDVAAFTGRYDALLAPSLGVVATPVDEDFEYGLPRASGRRSLNLAGVLAGTPTVSILNGFGEGGLPTGIQFAGAPLAENAILDAACALEQRLGLSAMRPPLTSPGKVRQAGDAGQAGAA